MFQRREYCKELLDNIRLRLYSIVFIKTFLKNSKIYNLLKTKIIPVFHSTCRLRDMFFCTGHAYNKSETRQTKVVTLRPMDLHVNWRKVFHLQA